MLQSKDILSIDDSIHFIFLDCKALFTLAPEKTVAYLLAFLVLGIFLAVICIWQISLGFAILVALVSNREVLSKGGATALTTIDQIVVSLRHQFLSQIQGQ